MEDKIDLFFKRVDSILTDIHQVQPKYFQRILFFPILETLAKVADPSIKKNGKRFNNFIEKYSDWEYIDRVSTIKLQKELLQKQDDDNCNGKRFDDTCKCLLSITNSRISEWTNGRIYNAKEVDQTVADFSQFQSTDCIKCISKAKYQSILWNIRNYNIHELRNPGHGVPISDMNNEPYYHGFTDNYGIKSWELYISDEIIATLIEKCKNNLKKYLLKQNVNPYDRYIS